MSHPQSNVGPPPPVDAPEPLPIVFGPAPGLFGWFHPPAGLPRPLAVLLCYPIGYEAICTHRSFRHLALRLAAEGFAVLRFDYSGTGDSPGSDADPERVRSWQESVVAALAELRRRAPGQRVAMVGLRLGALLGVTAAAGRVEVDSLVLFAPTVSGRAWVREVKAFAGMRAEAAAGAAPGRGPVAGAESAGFLFTDSTLDGISKLDLTKSPSAPARRALLVARDDLPGDDKLARHLSGLGVEVTVRDLPGYQAMMAYPHSSRVPEAVWAAAIEWLSQANPRGATPLPATEVEPPQLHLPAPPGGAAVLETPVRFAAGGRLFGILSEPAAGPRADTALMLLTMASHHRIGPNRLHVRWARQLASLGFPVLRFDVSGTGDSKVDQTGLENEPYSLEQVPDVTAAIELLASRGARRFIAAGFCSGAYLAYHAALAEPRLSGTVLINPQTFEWKTGDSLEIPQRPLTAEFKSSAFYRRALFEPATWLRLVRGELAIRGLARELGGRIAGRVRERLRTAWLRLVDPERAIDPILRAFEAMSARGAETLLVFGAEDAGVDYLEAHLGRGAALMRGKRGFQIQFVEGGTEHTFGQAWAQELISGVLERHLRERFSA